MNTICEHNIRNMYKGANVMLGNEHPETTKKDGSHQYNYPDYITPIVIGRNYSVNTPKGKVELFLYTYEFREGWEYPDKPC